MYRVGKTTFATFEAKDIFVMRHSLNDLEYVYKQVKKKLPASEREIMLYNINTLKKLLKQKQKRHATKL